MSSSFGEKMRVTVFGESHGAAIGVVVDGFPEGECVDFQDLGAFMKRRAPGGKYATKRREPDVPEVLSGLTKGRTNGAPFCAIIRNTDIRPVDYNNLSSAPRPGHADYTALLRYGGYSDGSGGGHFSGRLTAALCIAGGVALQMLARRGVTVGAHLYSVEDVEDARFGYPLSPEEALAAGKNDFPTIDRESAGRMMSAIEQAAIEGDSVGGVVECAAVGVPAGLGDPMFSGMENRLAAALFGIPAVKGVEFGAGFEAARLRGSRNNDPFGIADGRIVTSTNNCGGILGGITDGMPIVFRAAFKPTPSIAQKQRTVDVNNMEETEISVRGRHDPCVAVRAVPVVEAVAACVILDMLIQSKNMGR